MAYPVSSRWERFVRRGLKPYTVVDVRLPGEGTVLRDLPISVQGGGRISFDRTATIRSSGSITVASQELSPLINDESVLSPHGAEIVIRSGLIYPEGILALHRGATVDDVLSAGGMELVPMGVFGIESADSSESEGNIANIDYFDRMRAIERVAHVAPIDYGGQQIQAVIEDVIMRAAPFYPGDGVEWGISFAEDLENFALPFGTIMDKNPGEFLKELRESLGAEIFFDRNGDARVEPVRNIYVEDLPTIVPDWILDTGEDGVLKDASKGVSRDGVYNGVVVVGSGDEDRAPPFAFVTDDDPNSPTYYHGKFGKSILREEDGNLTTEAQCEVAARAKLRNRTGLQRSVSYEIVGHAATDPADVLELRYLNGQREIRLLDSYTYDFITTGASGDTRAVQYVTPEEVA